MLLCKCFWINEKSNGQNEAFVPELKLKGKKSAGIVVGGAAVDDDSVQMTAKLIEIFCTGHYRQMEFLGNFIASGREPEDVSKQENTIQKLKQFGEKIE